MAAENLLLCKTFNISSDYNNLSTALDQFTFVKVIGANFTVDQSVGSQSVEAPIGITQESGKKGDGIAVGMVGISKLRLAGTVSAGQFINATLGGEGVRHFGNGIAAAQALQTGADNNVIEVLILSNFATAA